MKQRQNKWRIARGFLAAIMFGLLTLSVLHPKILPKFFLTQAGSDALAIIGNLSIGAIVALASILVITLILGRVYCSVLCPLGILQDILGHFHLGKYHYLPWKLKVRLPVFCLVLVAAICGFMLPLTLLMPSSNFVGIINNVLREPLRLLANATGFPPQSAALRPMPLVQITGWGLLLGLLALSQWKGRIFCNTLCPVGAVLGLFSRKAALRISIDAEKCIGCGACERTCKATCIDSKHATVHNDECVMCLNCLSQCPKDALHLKHPSAAQAQVQASRREFLIQGGTAVASIALGASTKFLPGKQAVEGSPIMPPGAVNRERFSARCLGCGLCIGACTTRTLKASVTEYGLRGFQQPLLDPTRGPCDFSCNKCSQVCPCGALQPLALPEKRTTRIGLAKWEASLCIAYVDEEDCGACAEHCPIGALTMESVPGKRAKVPKVNTDLCIGCGACQNICPVRPVTAIVVHGVTEQCRVNPPQEKQPEIKLKAEEDFPF